MRDTIELEAMGVPVALITAAGRIPRVTWKKGVYFVSQSRHADFDGDLDDPQVQRGIAKFSFHRQLRLAGCKEGDEVEIGGKRMKWKYPSREFEESKRNWPSGFSKWHSRVDGIKNFRPIETPDPTFGLSVAEIGNRVSDLTPQVCAILMNR